MLQTRATCLAPRVLKSTLRMRRILECSWEEISFARSDKRFSPSGPHSFAGMTDKTILVIPDVPHHNSKNKTAAEVYHSITKRRSDELLHPQDCGFCIKLTRFIFSWVVLLLKGHCHTQLLPTTHPAQNRHFPRGKEQVELCRNKLSAHKTVGLHHLPRVWVSIVSPVQHREQLPPSPGLRLQTYCNLQETRRGKDVTPLADVHVPN